MRSRGGKHSTSHLSASEMDQLVREHQGQKITLRQFCTLDEGKRMDMQNMAFLIERLNTTEKQNRLAQNPHSEPFHFFPTSLIQLKPAQYPLQAIETSLRLAQVDLKRVTLVFTFQSRILSRVTTAIIRAGDRVITIREVPIHPVSAEKLYYKYRDDKRLIKLQLEKSLQSIFKRGNDRWIYDERPYTSIDQLEELPQLICNMHNLVWGKRDVGADRIKGNRLLVASLILRTPAPLTPAPEIAEEVMAEDELKAASVRETTTAPITSGSRNQEVVKVGKSSSQIADTQGRMELFSEQEVSAIRALYQKMHHRLGDIDRAAKEVWVRECYNKVVTLSEFCTLDGNTPISVSILDFTVAALNLTERKSHHEFFHFFEPSFILDHACVIPLGALDLSIQQCNVDVTQDTLVFTLQSRYSGRWSTAIIRAKSNVIVLKETPISGTQARKNEEVQKDRQRLTSQLMISLCHVRKERFHERWTFQEDPYQSTVKEEELVQLICNMHSLVGRREEADPKSTRSNRLFVAASILRLPAPTIKSSRGDAYYGGDYYDEDEKEGTRLKVSSQVSSLGNKRKRETTSSASSSAPKRDTADKRVVNLSKPRAATSEMSLVEECRRRGSEDREGSDQEKEDECTEGVRNKRSLGAIVNVGEVELGINFISGLSKSEKLYSNTQTHVAGALATDTHAYKASQAKNRGSKEVVRTVGRTVVRTVGRTVSSKVGTSSSNNTPKDTLTKKSQQSKACEREREVNDPSLSTPIPLYE